MDATRGDGYDSVTSGPGYDEPSAGVMAKVLRYFDRMKREYALDPTRPEFGDPRMMASAAGNQARGSVMSAVDLGKMLAESRYPGASAMLPEVQRDALGGDPGSAAFGTGENIGFPWLGPAGKVAAVIGATKGSKSVGKAVKKAEEALVKRSREQVGTTGQFIGAPPGVTTQAQVDAIVENYVKFIEDGVPGREFYNESSEEFWKRSGKDKPLADLVAGNTAITSRRQQVGGNTALLARGHSQAMTGQPMKSVGLPGNDESLEKLYAPQGADYLGHKREPFAEQLSVKWAPERIGRGVNDMHEAEIMGFPRANLSATNHAFMDDVRDRAIALANERKIGGFDDWNTGNSQAAAWTANKIRRGEVKPGDAAKTYAYYLPSAEANATYESLPGLATGHLPGSETAPYAEKQAFHDYAIPGKGKKKPTPVGNWTQGDRDILYTKAGMLPGADAPSVGRFGQEVNPATVARPVISKEVGGLEISPYSKDALDAVEAMRAYFDVQNAGAWHKGMSNAAQPAYNIAAVQFPGLSEDLMKKLAPVFEAKGFDIASGPKGVSVINFKGPEGGGEAFAKDVRSTLKKQFPEAGKPEFGSLQSGYVDYGDLWKQPQGSGEVTRSMLGFLDKSPLVAARLDDPAVRKVVGEKNVRDAAFPQWGAPRDDVTLARKIFSEEGVDGIRKALAAGALLPATAFLFLGGQPQDEGVPPPQ